MRKPDGIDERPEQLRPPVVKSEGTTDAERYLARLAERSFLNLWSFPSPYRDQKQGGAGDGKELCDLLVVCGDHIIIFSEKTIEWPGGDISTAWRRWAKKAIGDSAKQTKGAERWLSDFPDRVFLDRDCTKPFPIDLPQGDNRQVHRVVVANGSAKACRAQMPGSSGSLTIDPRVTGVNHWTSNDADLEPFMIGDIDPENSFVHVFNETALDIVMAELDTITDFTEYLTKKADFIRSGQLLEARGEENLLAYYAVRINEDGDHDFVIEIGQAPIVIDHGEYANMAADARYRAKKIADKGSYLWDRLIETFARPVLDGTSITPFDQDFDLRKSELGLRHMALVPRFMRRAHSEAVAGALESGRKTEKFFRMIMGPPEAKENETAFFFQTFKYLDWMEKSGGYEHYRRKRSESAVVYARGILEQKSHLKRVVGISCEPPGQGRGGSEDLVYAEQSDWSDAERKSIRADCATLGVLQNLKETRYHGEEFPEVEEIRIDRPAGPRPLAKMNRKQRRSMKAKGRKR